MQAKGIVLSVTAALLVAGCVNYDERIELNTDGSGIARIHLAIAEQVLPAGLKPKAETEADLLPVPREELVREIESEGFKVTSLRAESSQGLRHFYLVLEFRSLEDLTKSEFFGGRKVSLKRNGGRWELRQEINVSEETLTNPDRIGTKKPREEKPGPGEKSGTKPEQTENAIRQIEARLGKERVRQMFSNYSLSFSVRLNGAGLLRTNGRNHQDTTAVWEIPLSQLIEKKPVVRMQADFALAELPPAPKEKRP
jgi:hypothetical protein